MMRRKGKISPLSPYTHTHTNRNMPEGNVVKVLIMFISRWWDIRF